MRFFSKSILLKELELLEHISRNPNTTQKKISEKIGSAPSMVNEYINRLEFNGYMRREYSSKKIVDYIITDKGIKRKNYLVVSYLDELMKQYSKAKKSVEDYLYYIKKSGNEKVLIYGAGEVAEIILSVIENQDIGLEIVGIIDDDVRKQGKKKLGYMVYDLENGLRLEHDIISITTYSYEDNILNNLKKYNYNLDKVKSFFKKY